MVAFWHGVVTTANPWKGWGRGSVSKPTGYDTTIYHVNCHGRNFGRYRTGVAGAYRMNRTLLSVAIGAALALSALATYSYIGRNGSTPAFRTAAGSIVPGSIAEMRRVRLGGIDQSIVIRGRDPHAPILVWLHGGPGLDATGMWRHFNAVLEDHFLVIYWTQRGTGRSYSADISARIRCGSANSFRTLMSWSLT